MAMLRPRQTEVREQSGSELRTLAHVQHVAVGAAHDVHTGVIARVGSYVCAKLLNVRSRRADRKIKLRRR